MASGRIHLGAAFWIQRSDWPSLCDAVRRADESGYDSVWVDDHLLSDEGSWSDPRFEGWTTAAALAMVTSSASIGHLVVANTFRNPGLTAKQAVTLDHISDGRAVLGIGAAWFEREHEAFGLEYGRSFVERGARLAESLGVIKRLLAGELVSHDGPFVRLQDAIGSPTPIQRHLPILIGGHGSKTTLPLVARFADHWNAYGTPELLAEKASELEILCDRQGRAFGTIQRSVTVNVVVRPRSSDAEAVWDEYRRVHEPREDGGRALIGGSIEQVVGLLLPYVKIGIRGFIFGFRAPWDIETIRQAGAIREALEACI